MTKDVLLAVVLAAAAALVVVLAMERSGKASAPVRSGSNMFRDAEMADHFAGQEAAFQ